MKQHPYLVAAAIGSLIGFAIALAIWRAGDPARGASSGTPFTVSPADPPPKE